MITINQLNCNRPRNLSERQYCPLQTYKSVELSGDFSKGNLVDELGQNSIFKFHQVCFLHDTILYLIFNTLPYMFASNHIFTNFKFNVLKNGASQN